MFLSYCCQCWSTCLGSADDFIVGGVTTEVEHAVSEVITPRSYGSDDTISSITECEVTSVISENDEWDLIPDGEACWTDSREDHLVNSASTDDDPLGMVDTQTFGRAPEDSERFISMRVEETEAVQPCSVLIPFNSMEKTLARHAATVGFGIEFNVDDERAPLVSQEEKRSIRHWVL